MHRAGWIERGSRLQIDRRGCEWTEEAANRRRRLRTGRAGYRWAEKARNRGGCQGIEQATKGRTE